MIVILGAGISGLMLAQRMRAAKRKYVLLDKFGVMMSGNDGGFFYAHEPSPFTEEQSFKIIVDACSGGSSESYAMKVYGEPKANLESSSFAKFGEKGKTWIGWRYSREKLRLGIGDSKEVFISEVDCVDLDAQAVYDSQGRVWKYSSLLSTIPLPVLTRITIHNNAPISRFVRAPKFRNRPIYLSSKNPEHMDDGTDLSIKYDYSTMHVKYCASSCCQFYRRTLTLTPGRVPNLASEYSSEPTTEKAIKLYPGKIWLDDEKDKADLRSLHDYFLESRVSLWGRYGSWTPKELAEHVWARSVGLWEALP
jgi:hypothetical protein